MSYRLNKTDGTLLTELIDGKIDNTSTELTFIGKNYQGFGEFINENFIKLLESFANVSAPSKPIKGQLWFDTTNNRLKVFDGVTFRSTDNSVISTTAPLEKIEGDIWIDSSKDQMYYWTGSEWILVGPVYTKSQGLSGFKVETVKDNFALDKTILKLFVAGVPILIIAKESFTPGAEITGFTNLRMGININSAYSTFVTEGIADKALAITDQFGTAFTINDFVSATDSNGDTMAGKLHVNNDLGLIVGNDSDHTLKVSGDTVEQINNITSSNYKLSLKNSVGSYAAQYWDADNKRLGILNVTPSKTLDVNGDGRFSGDLRIEGNLTVGTVVNESVTSLRVADKNIQLAIPDDSSLLDSTSDFVDDAGLLIETQGGSIKWTYRVAKQAWTTEDNINIDDDNGELMIGGDTVLTKTALSSTVTSAPGLINIGSLASITIDNITIDGDRITNATNGIDINAAGAVNLITQQKITNVTTAVSARAVSENPLLTEDADSTVATKGYVDTELGSKTLVFGLDVTGLTITVSSSASDNNDVKAILTSLVNPVTIPNGTLAFIHASSTAVTGTDTADVNSQLNKSFLAVDSGGTQNVSVIQDVSVGAVPISTTFNITRYTMKFKVIAGVWSHEVTTTYTP
tara:strand:+ start:33098 stop:34993 length:1896 start_codon:yes stop_codon:yes gene_type:complete